MREPIDLVIRDGRIVTPSGIVSGDIAVRDGKISEVGTFDSRATRELDAGGKWVMPGGVDPHAHIEQMSGMGLMNADTFETATTSAAMGGTTSVICFAAQSKGQRLSETVKDYTQRARRGAMIDYAFHITITDAQAPDFNADLADLIRAGHRSLKLFTTYDIRLDDAQILDAMSMARDHGALVCIHAENDAIISRARASLIAAGHVSPRDHARSRPRIAEIEAVERMCRFAEYVDQPIMLFHISTREAAEAVQAARQRGAPVWAETCPHYLFMTQDILDQPGGAKWMCSPPQRTAADQHALWQALDRGDLEVVSSDHAPYRYDSTGKLSAGPDAGFHQIANGLPGLETRLPLMFDAMVSQDRGGAEAFARVTATAPADIHGLATKGRIERGMDADIVIWDDTRQITFGANDLHDNVGYNPWENRTITGWPQTVFLRGEVVLDKGAFLGKAGAGQWQKRTGLGRAVTAEGHNAKT